MMGKTEMFSKVEDKLMANLAFFNRDQLIANVFYYVRAGCLSNTLLEAFVKSGLTLFRNLMVEQKSDTSAC
jgi:hypothetical protein